MSALELDRLLARHTVIQSTAQTFRMEYIGSGQWIVPDAMRDGLFYTGWSFSGLAADHIYLVSPQGDMRGFAVHKTASTTTALGASDNQATTLIDTAADFSTTLVGDVVILSSGASAFITEVDNANDTLTTDPLPQGSSYVVGQTYYIGRAPGTDTTATYSPTARLIDGKRAAVQQIEHWITAKSFDQQVSIGSGSMTPNTDAVRQRLSELIGVGVSYA